MAKLKTFMKSKTFVIYSILAYLLLSVFVVCVSQYFWEPKAYDYMIRTYSALEAGSEEIVIVAIDDKSIAKYPLPWERDKYAKILDYMGSYANTRAIGFDMLLTAYKNPKTDRQLFDTISKIDNLVVGFSPDMAEYEDKDAGELYNQNFYNKFKINITDKRTSKYPPTYSSIIQFPKDYFNAVKNTGSVNVVKLANYRNSPNLITANQVEFVGNDSYPSLALRMYLLINKTKDITLYNNNIVVDETRLKIPTFTTLYGIQDLIHYYKCPPTSDFTHKKYSASDIIDSYNSIKRGEKPHIAPEEFKDKVIFIGTNAKATGLGLEDSMPTPIHPSHPGVDIQATFLDNLMHNEFMRQLAGWQENILYLLISIFSFFVISRMSFMKSLGTITAFGMVYFGLAAACYNYLSLALPVITPLVMVFVTMIFGYAYRYIAENRGKEKVKHAMGRYLSQDIMRNVVQNIDDIKLGGKRANVTVLFADIRGFTSISENLTTEELSSILNEYFTEIEPIITKYNGVINKFIGDAVMAIFGEPIQDIHHPANAVKCGWEMLKMVDRLQDKWLKEGKPKIEIGIGINTGDAFVGNIGSEKRLEYTVIGDMVNIASRIESYNKTYRTNFLISASTYSFVSDIADVIKISEVTIRGKSKKMDIYEILRLRND